MCAEIIKWKTSKGKATQKAGLKIYNVTQM